MNHSGGEKETVEYIESMNRYYSLSSTSASSTSIFFYSILVGSKLQNLVENIAIVVAC